MVQAPPKLLIAASGTGGHLFPALAIAEQLPDWQIEWLGVPDRLETRLIPDLYPLHIVAVEGFQSKSPVKVATTIAKFIAAIFRVRRLLQLGQFQGVLTTGGYIAAPAIIAARSLKLPTILHESNALPGKVTRWLSPWCTTIALGFASAAQHLPHGQTVAMGTPVRRQFLQDTQQPLPHGLVIPDDAQVLLVVGGSQGAVSLNRLVRPCLPEWLAAGIWVIHQTGDNDPEVGMVQHPHYITAPFYPIVAPLLQRANLVISRAGAGTLTELAFTGKPSILIPYPFAADDHQAYNAQALSQAGAALFFRQDEIPPAVLATKVLGLIQSPATLAQMAQQAKAIAVPDSAQRMAQLVNKVVRDPTPV